MMTRFTFLACIVFLFSAQASYAQIHNQPRIIQDPIDNGDVVYKLDDARVKTPLDTRVVFQEFSDTEGRSLWAIFDKIVSGHGKEYCIVRVRIIHDIHGSTARFEFLYTEWANVLPDPNAPKLKAEKEPGKE